MENGNFVPNELTGQAQNAYSRGMPENTGEIQQNSPEVNPVNANQNTDSEARRKAAILQRALQDPNLDLEVRAAMESLLGDYGVGAQPQQPTRLDNVDLSGRMSLGATEDPSHRASSGTGGRRNREGLDTNFEVIDSSNFSDPVLREIAEDLVRARNSQAILRTAPLLDEFKKRFENRAQILGESDEVEKLRNNLVKAERARKNHQANLEAGAEYTLSLSLTQADFDRLRGDPIAWLREEMNRIYELSMEGQELDSQQLRDFQSRQGSASRYLTQMGASPEVIRIFDEEFLTKLNIMYARSTIQQRNLEGITGMSTRLGTHGILNALTFENGMVGMMHNRIQELYDDVRIRSLQHHITPQEHSKIQQRVINEYTDLILNDEELTKLITGNIFLGEQGTIDAVKAAVTRSVRTGYDHFVASQREGVIVARGEALLNKEDLEGIIADPSGLFQAFNLEQMLIAKFGLLNEEQEEFFSALKRRYAESVLDGKNIDSWVNERIKLDPDLIKNAEEKGRSVREQALINYGQSLMRDLMLVNDFYSSGWRVERFMLQLNEILKYHEAEKIFASTNRQKYDELRSVIDKKDTSAEYFRYKNIAQVEYSRSVKQILDGMTPEQIANINEQAKDFGLFMRLRAIETGKFEGSHEKQKITKIAEKRNTWSRIAQFRPEDVIKLFREKGTEAEYANVNEAFRSMGLTAGEGQTLYDAFKDEFGAAIRMIREKGFSNKDANGISTPEQIDFSQINSNPAYAKYRGLLVKHLTENSGDPASIAQAEAKVESIAKVFDAMKKFALEKKTIDTLMNDVRFEDVYKRTYTVDDVMLDKMESVDQNAGLVPVSRQLDPEAAGGAYRRTFNDFAKAQEAYQHVFEFLRVEGAEEKMKAALAAAEAASHYGGPEVRAKAFRYLYGNYMLMGSVTEEGASRLRTLYEVMDMKLLPGRKAITELQKIFGPEAPAFNNDEMFKFLEQHKSDLVGAHGEEMWEEMRRLARVRAWDRTKFRIYRGLIYGLIWLAFEAVYGTVTAGKEGFKSEDLG